jgi:RNA-directed DNA polymerase
LIINRMLKGWVNYFAHGNAARCFTFIRIWVEKKVRRHLMRNSKRKGFGWKRWSTSWLTAVQISSPTGVGGA